MYCRATGELADRALLRFGLTASAAAQARRTSSILRPGMLLVALRTVVACLATAGGVLFVLLTGARVAGHAWLAMFLVLLGLSAVAVGWRWFRARRHRRTRAG